MDDVATRAFSVEREIVEAVRAEIASRVRLKCSEKVGRFTGNAKFTVTGPAKALEEVEQFITAKKYDAWLDRQ